MIPISNIKEIYHLLMLTLSMVGILILIYHVYLLIMNELIQKAFRAIKNVEIALVVVNNTTVEATNRIAALETRLYALENNVVAPVVTEDLSESFRLAEELGY